MFTGNKLAAQMDAEQAPDASVPATSSASQQSNFNPLSTRFPFQTVKSHTLGNLLSITVLQYSLEIFSLDKSAHVKLLDD